MAETNTAPPLAPFPDADELARMNPLELAQVRERADDEAIDAVARMKLLADLAIEKLPNTTDEDDSRYALQLLLDQFAIERQASSHIYMLYEELFSRLNSSSRGTEGGSR